MTFQPAATHYRFRHQHDRADRARENELPCLLNSRQESIRSAVKEFHAVLFTQRHHVLRISQRYRYRFFTKNMDPCLGAGPGYFPVQTSRHQNAGDIQCFLFQHRVIIGISPKTMHSAHFVPSLLARFCRSNNVNPGHLLIGAQVRLGYPPQSYDSRFQTHYITRRRLGILP